MTDPRAPQAIPRRRRGRRIARHDHGVMGFRLRQTIAKPPPIPATGLPNDENDTVVGISTSFSENTVALAVSRMFEAS
jgi:hypothetical protein